MKPLNKKLLKTSLTGGFQAKVTRSGMQTSSCNRKLILMNSNMKRTIKFRGKKASNGIWVYGYLVELSELNVAIYFPVAKGCVTQMEWVYVDPDTVAQFTGLLDKNGKEIYEGDIVKTKQFGKDVKSGDHFTNVSGEDSFEIKYTNAQFVFNNKERCFYLHRNTSCEVIGNIHDNPELLK